MHINTPSTVHTTIFISYSSEFLTRLLRLSATTDSNSPTSDTTGTRKAPSPSNVQERGMHSEIRGNYGNWNKRCASQCNCIKCGSPLKWRQLLLACLRQHNLPCDIANVFMLSRNGFWHGSLQILRRCSPFGNMRYTSQCGGSSIPNKTSSATKMSTYLPCSGLIS